MKLKKLGISAIIVAVAAAIFIPMMSTFAASLSGGIVKKAEVGDLKRCYSLEVLPQKIDDVTQIYNVSKIINDVGDVNLPNGTSLVGDTGVISCRKLIEELVDTKGVTTEQKTAALTKLGYKGTKGSAKTKCISITLVARGANNTNSNITAQTDGVCFEVDSKNKITSTKITSESRQNTIAIVDTSGESCSGSGTHFCMNILDSIEINNSNYNKSVSFSVGDSINSVASRMEEAIKSVGDINSGADGETKFTYKDQSITGGDSGGAAVSWTLDKTNPYSKVLGTNLYTLSDKEKQELYEYYLAKYGDFVCNDDDFNSSYSVLKVKIGKTETSFYFKWKSDAPQQFAAPTGKAWDGQTWVGRDDVFNYLNGKTLVGGDIRTCEESNGNPNNDDTKAGGWSTSKTDEEDGPCFNNGVGALGWILCPIIKLMRQAVETMYDDVITPFLEIDGDAFKTDSPAFTAWQTFQSFANILFVIFLLLVIFSQITGYGIDNYGIKRMLPKLIIAAILVNLSFVICQLAVDISNISGVAVNNLFNTMATNAMGDITVGTGKAAGATIISGAVGIGATTLAVTTWEIWLPMMILPLILGLIAMIVSILFIFVLLGARRAAAVILVVISPLAFIMYMLPNTKKLFDKWLNAFKAVLLVFPICGLLMGGGAFVGALLWKTSEGYFLGQLLAALMTVIPFFFIPRVLKGTMSAVGNIGNMISGVGGTIGRGLGTAAKGAVGNSNWYNNMQSGRKDILEERNRNREQERAQRIVDRLKSRQASGRTLTESQQLRMARALNTVERMKDENDFASRPELITSEAEAKRRQRRVSAREQEIIQSGSVDNMQAMRQQLTRAITGNDAIAIEAYQNVMSAKGEQGREAVHGAMEDAEAQMGVSLDPEARQAYASNIMNGKFANDYKNNSRSTFEYAKANAGDGTGGSMTSFAGAGVDSLTQQKMVDMDEAELIRYQQAAESAKRTMESSDASAEAKESAKATYNTITTMAQGALGNQRLSQGLKTSQRKVLEKIAGPSTNVLDVRGANNANRHTDAAMARAAEGTRNPVRNTPRTEGQDQYEDYVQGGGRS